MRGEESRGCRSPARSHSLPFPPTPPPPSRSSRARALGSARRPRPRRTQADARRRGQANMAARDPPARARARAFAPSPLPAPPPPEPTSRARSVCGRAERSRGPGRGAGGGTTLKGGWRPPGPARLRLPQRGMQGYGRTREAAEDEEAGGPGTGWELRHRLAALPGSRRFSYGSQSGGASSPSVTPPVPHVC